MIDKDGNEKPAPTCVSCKFYYLPWYKRLIGFQEFGRCSRTVKEVTTYDAVTGKTVTKNTNPKYCSSERETNHPLFCGGNAIFWQPKNTKEHLFTLLTREIK